MDSSPEFRKLSNDVASRKYRRHSSTSASDGSPKPGRSSSPVIVRGRSDKVSDRTSGRKGDGIELERDSVRHQSTRAGDSRRHHHDRPSSRSSHRHDDHEDRHHLAASHHGREAARPDHASKDNDDRDRHRGRDGYGHRSRGERMRDRKRDHIGDCSLHQSRGHRIESSGREIDGHCSRESYEEEDRELDSLKEKEQLCRDPKKGVDDRDSLPKKAKLFDSSSDIDGKKNGGEHKPKAEQAQANTSDVANDLNAAKVAALKAAELVNKNLVGVGFMSTEQKKKLLWGNKKSTASEEVGPKWNTAMFGDRERQEKFNKLMSLRLPWYLWPNVGCQRRCENGQQPGQARHWRSSGSREAEGTPDRSGETVYSWSSPKRRAHRGAGSLSIHPKPLVGQTMTLSFRLLYFPDTTTLSNLTCLGLKSPIVAYFGFHNFIARLWTRVFVL